MNKNMLKALGIDESQVIQPKQAKRSPKESTDTPKVRDIREKMQMTYVSGTSLISASYLEPKYKRDANNKILLDKEGNKAIEGYLPKSLKGQYIVEDNGNGTHTATKLNVYKETYIIDSESLSETKITS